MTGVNDLADRWKEEWVEDWETRYNVYECSECAEELEHVARTAWHPVSEPPTESDGDDNGDVMLYDTHEGSVLKIPWDEAGVMGLEYRWARINDVVLLPA